MMIRKKTAISFIALVLIFFISTVSAFAMGPGNGGLSTRLSISLGESKQVPLYIENIDSKPHEYILSVTGQSNKYDMYFSTHGNPIESLRIPSGGSSQIDLNVALKESSLSNADTLVVKMIRDDNIVNEMDVAVQISKDYSLAISSITNKIEILNGKSSEITLMIKNNGVKKVDSVKLSSEMPYKWIVSQDTGSNISLKPGEEGSIKIKIEVPASQVSGNYTAKFTAEGGGVKSEPVSILTTVKANANIAIWMMGIFIIIAAFTFIQFRKHGRR